MVSKRCNRIFFAWWFILFFFCCTNITKAQDDQERQKIFSSERCVLLIPFDFESLHCSLCMQDFLDLRDFLNANIIKFEKKLCVLGIIIPVRGAEKNIPQTIIRKQLGVFLKANRICFPVVIDNLSLFEGLYQYSPGVIWIDLPGNSLLQWEFPLSPADKKKLFELIEK